MMDAQQIKVISFDCYGTLIDWQTGLVSTIKQLLANHGVFTTDDEILRKYFTLEIKFQSGKFINYKNVLTNIIFEMCKENCISPNEAEKVSIVESLKKWQPFLETLPALGYLQKYFQLAILSNIDNDLFEHTRRYLPINFNSIITSEDLRKYKPSKIFFVELINQLKVKPQNILHVSCSLYHDVAVAQQLGINTIFINRESSKLSLGESNFTEPDLTFSNLYSLAAYLLKSFEVEI